jgi:general secretion pathway protein G
MIGDTGMLASFLKRRITDTVKKYLRVPARRSAHFSQRGLTLVEIVVVLVILVTIVTLLGGRIFAQGQQALIDLTNVKMRQIGDLVNQFQFRYGSFPASINDLYECSDRSGQACVPLTTREELVDAWRTPLQYSLENSGRTFRIRSLGRDKREGGTGADADISFAGP